MLNKFVLTLSHAQAEIEHDDTDDLATLLPTSLDSSNSQTISQLPGFDAPVSCSLPPSANVGIDEQSKLLNFPDALTRPVPQSLNNYPFTDNSFHYNLLQPPINMQSTNEACDQGQRNSSPDPHHTSDDCTDMQTDDPSQKSVYKIFNHK